MVSGVAPRLQPHARGKGGRVDLCLPVGGARPLSARPSSECLGPGDAPCHSVLVLYGSVSRSLHQPTAQFRMVVKGFPLAVRTVSHLWAWWVGADLGAFLARVCHAARPLHTGQANKGPTACLLAGCSASPLLPNLGHGGRKGLGGKTK
ncbi:hypothetical protein NDU88_002653 [Pleurodeles waltl]|uniref:Uncharacterized protein n=1 Tax=Pleurodeles waltl TaxID=8319 RepID=A0AAV7TLV6_PLEWA|nr:hypothetical protein NDU88_002653 [Pleurodeles waltl]